MPSATLASTGDGATVPIHTTMAQPLLFSNSGRNVEPIRRRMARRGMRVASEAYTVPMQQPMPRLNKEFGHKVVDKPRRAMVRCYSLPVASLSLGGTQTANRVTRAA
ncbi:hypothetical protein FPSE_11793 [Fusarium pseudograminearum CS3096]|uniref:Uncharacterized protein n=1 Tax=Fusarium pseudograminearum (strain CS3096) TaxID=1028729 RepID=K3V4F3_FUSPC|nr:hypothetical protein FPSE_11793 [Fusarium pseudograminearum CS3096]EKJ67982.1 hypothetical protein FPSE_11793 [Fusarium pseudograminearum CS3096]